MSYRFFAPDVLRLRGDYWSQYHAVQQLVRPWEVAHLINHNPSPLVVLLSPPFADQVANWLRDSFATGALAYQLDPSGFLDYWYAPAATLRRGKGDCEDFSLLALSMLVEGGVSSELAIGTVWTGSQAVGHAWIEGEDSQGAFLIEATSGQLHRTWRPAEYKLHWRIAPKLTRRAA